jgi:hypothetical protein
LEDRLSGHDNGLSGQYLCRPDSGDQGAGSGDRRLRHEREPAGDRVRLILLDRGRRSGHDYGLNVVEQTPQVRKIEAHVGARDADILNRCRRRDSLSDDLLW